MEHDAMIARPRSLSDEELVTALTKLVRGERQTTAHLIAHLMEFDGRRLYLGAGCPSLFVYCTDVLRLSGHEAYHRIEAARIGRRFPVVLHMLAEGRLNLTTARLLGPHLNDANHEALLESAAGKSKREVQVLLAKQFPQPDVPTLIRKLPAPRAPEPVEEEPATSSVALPLEMSAAPMALPLDPPVATSAAVSATVPLPAQRRVRETDRPLSADRYEIRFTASAATREKLRLATDLLRHAVPDGDAAEIVDRALTALLDVLAKKKFAATPNPRAEGAAADAEADADAPTHTRHVPARVKRTVWVRDEAQCAFVSGGGRRCRERGFLEFHHVQPYGAGGAATIENIELRCRAHNGYDAERFYGRRYVPPAKARKSAPVLMEPRPGDAPRTTGGIGGRVELGPDRVGPLPTGAASAQDQS